MASPVNDDDDQTRDECHGNKRQLKPIIEEYITDLYLGI